MLAEFDYTNKPKMTFLDKTTPDDVAAKNQVLPWLYWNKILKGTA